MKTTKLHMIGNAHIDPVWLWQWQEGFHEVKATFRSALDRMQEYDDFIFTASSAAFYEWVEQSDPAMFTEIQQRVAEGRWEIVGGWWIEPDCNIPSGESFVRQALYAQRYFQEKFGCIATIGYAIDSFGHNATLPQLLKKSGMPYYVFMRPMPHEKKGLPNRLFQWEADDGSRVTTLQLPFEYTAWGYDVDDHVKRCAAEIIAPLDEFVCFYGVGNHGGGPTRANIESIHRLADASDLPAVVCSSLDAFFEAAEAKNWPLPLVHDDLQHHASGCYAAQSEVKQLNRRAENRLMAAEKLSLVASVLTGQPYPSNFAQAWKNVLFNQFHDIMAGTSLEAAYRDARNTFGESLAIADRAYNLATQAFAWHINVPIVDEMRPLVVFNPLTWPVRANIELESSTWSSTAVLLDDLNSVIPHQAVRSDSVTWRAKLSFNADLPALGYRTYRLMKELPAEIAPASDTTKLLQVSNQSMESDRFRIVFDPLSGAITELFDKSANLPVFSAPAARAVVMEDISDTWSHDVRQWDQIAGEFIASGISLVEHGPVKSVIRITSVYNKSTLVQNFTMYPDIDRIDVQVTVDWHEQLKMLKLRFPVNVDRMKVTYETAYGSIERISNGDEEPYQSWVDVSGEGNTALGFSLLNDSKYSVDVQGQDIGFTVLRSPAYAHHAPAELQPGEDYTYIDQGVQHFRYTLLPHKGDWVTADTVRQAALLNQPPTALFTTYHPEGNLPQSDSFIAVKPGHVIVSVLKQAEDSEDYILRAYETAKQATHAVIELPHLGRSIETDFAAGEIQTFRVPKDTEQTVKETDLLER